LKYQEAGEYCIVRGFLTCTLGQVSINKIKEDEIGEACSKQERRVFIQDFGKNARRKEIIRKT
jgi:hypothetical protein